MGWKDEVQRSGSEIKHFLVAGLEIALQLV